MCNSLFLFITPNLNISNSPYYYHTLPAPPYKSASFRLPWPLPLHHHFLSIRLQRPRRPPLRVLSAWRQHRWRHDGYKKFDHRKRRQQHLLRGEKIVILFLLVRDYYTVLREKSRRKNWNKAYNEHEHFVVNWSQFSIYRISLTIITGPGSAWSSGIWWRSKWIRYIV